MQLATSTAASPLRGRLRAAAWMLLASAAPAVARADSVPATQFDATALLYGEQNRANVVEPTARVTRLFADGQSLSAQFGFDVITGASPSGGMPSGVTPTGPVQTTTTPSGQVKTVQPPSPGEIPLSKFNDTRGVLDVEWQKPIGTLTSTLGGHFSREKDYQSLGASAKASVDVMNRLTTLTAGYGFDYDDVLPVGGTRAGLSDGSIVVGRSADLKRVMTGLVGVSRVLTRRWIVGVNATRTVERGYLTEPYKIVSLLDPVSGVNVGSLTENRPSTRDRRDVLTSSVYHLTEDVVHVSYRYYWDDWGVRSHTMDVAYRHELGDENYLEPHVRYYAQTQASFFRFGMINGAPLPDFATSDYRLGPLRTATVGATYGFHLPSYPGEWSVRAEYLAQFGNGHPHDAPGIQRTFDLFPTLSIGSLVIAYSVEF